MPSAFFFVQLSQSGVRFRPPAIQEPAASANKCYFFNLQWRGRVWDNRYNCVMPVNAAQIRFTHSAQRRAWLFGGKHRFLLPAEYK